MNRLTKKNQKITRKEAQRNNPIYKNKETCNVELAVFCFSVWIFTSFSLIAERPNAGFLVCFLFLLLLLLVFIFSFDFFLSLGNRTSSHIIRARHHM